MTGRLFVFGLGLTGKALARALVADGWRVAGTTRTAASAAALTEEGLEALPFGPDAPLDVSAPAFFEATHILGSAPPGPDGDPALTAAAGPISRLERLEWTGYLSTTGVYGNLNGGEATERSPLAPTSERSARRVAAEVAWRALSPSATVFRLPGIYGPGRNAFEQVLRDDARRISKPGHRFSRIHVDDIVSAVRASIAQPRPGAVYNVVDDEPAESAAVQALASELLGRPPPPTIAFGDADLSPMARSFYGDDKIVSNALIKRELGWLPRYPSYREGLRALVSDYSAG